MGRLKDIWREKRPELISGALFGVTRSIGSTLRIQAENFPADPSKTIFCGWHGRSVVFANYFRNRGYWVIISRSRDGDMQNEVFSRLGFRTIRGSTGRGGVRAAIEGIRVLKDGGTMAMTPDGPRGPSGIIQGGVILMAQKAGASLVPVGISARPRWLAKSWDQFLVPLPFARGILIFGEPLVIPKEATPAEVELVRLELERECHRLQGLAEARLARKSTTPDKL